jgi:hypothetical protein
LTRDPIEDFRLRAKWCLAMPLNGTSRHEIVVDGERVVTGDALRLEAGGWSDATIFCRSSFRCGDGCRIGAPVYAGAAAEIGADTYLEAIAAEGDLLIGPGAEIRLWAYSGARLCLRPGAVVGWLARAGSAIHLGADAQARILQAPAISTQAVRPPAPAWSPGVVYEIDSPDNSPSLPSAPGTDPGRWRALSPQTWLYEGSLAVEAPLWIRAGLVVRGAFACGSGSLIEGSLSAGGSARIGAGSLVTGHAEAAGDLTVNAGVIFQSSLAAGQTVLLRSGVRGFRESGPVSVTSGGATLLEPDVVVRGRIDARGLVRAL